MGLTNKIVRIMRQFSIIQLLIIGSTVLLLLTISHNILTYRSQQTFKEQSTLISLEHEISSLTTQLITEQNQLNDLLSTDDQNNRQSQYRDSLKTINELTEELQVSYQKIDVNQELQNLLTEYQDSWQKLQIQFDSQPAIFDDAEMSSAIRSTLKQTQIALTTMSKRNLSELNEHLSILNGAEVYAGELLYGIYWLFALIVLLIVFSFWNFVNEHHKTENALLASQQRYKALLEAIPDAVLRRDRAGIYTDFKPANEFGRFMPSQDFLGKHISEILPPEIAEQSMGASEKALMTGEEQVYKYRMPHRQTGILRDYEARVLPSGTDEVQVIIRDITDEKLRDAQNREAQKLESLGILAGGIAHDFNNLLTGIISHISLAKIKSSVGQPIYEQLDKSEDGAKSAAILVSQLLAYAGKGKFQVVALDLNELIQNTYSLVEAALPNRTQLRVNLEQSIPRIKADRGQIQQVIMNLVINAAEAIQEKGGYIEIITSSRMVDENNNLNNNLDNLIGNELAPGKHVMLQVYDNGVGMEPEIRARIFEPFFTTKTQGHGLGLSATLGIMRAHHGAIDVKSKIGEGTSFTLTFPAVDDAFINKMQPDDFSETSFYTNFSENKPQMVQPVMAKTEELSTNPSVPVCQGTVLLIDDEAIVRDAMSDILTFKDFRVFVAKSGEEGLECYQQHQHEIDIIILDMKMPGMGGKETMFALQQANPHVKVILSSGYSETEISNQFEGSPIMAFMQKPYSLSRMIQKIQAMIEEKHPIAS